MNNLDDFVIHEDGDREIVIGSNDVLDEPLGFFKSDVEFSQYIETKSILENQTPLETLVEFMEERDCEPEQLKNLISESLRAKLEHCFIENGMLRSGASLGEFME